MKSCGPVLPCPREEKKKCGARVMSDEIGVSNRPSPLSIFLSSCTAVKSFLFFSSPLQFFLLLLSFSCVSCWLFPFHLPPFPPRATMDQSVRRSIFPFPFSVSEELKKCRREKEIKKKKYYFFWKGKKEKDTSPLEAPGFLDDSSSRHPSNLLRLLQSLTVG